ncbi:hypothetical protein CRE_14845 [Caenorhabditis remanei]|uniref:Uncharacterized protein n=1 Tax=Caenorhabditis remanei TaxID=31234 RepID=E3N1Y4_CAERE|nr:hypothetical protein CRE_14845 [Caenorhabditis remanei]
MDCSTSTEICLPDVNHQKCQICSQPAHGQHFGAVTCRACAAFFRRCHFSKEAKPKCRNMKFKCNPDENGRWSCKKCRLDRCLGHGMSTKNIQYDRDSFRSSKTFLKKRLLSSYLTERVPATVEKILGSPHYICFKLKSLPTNHKFVYIDMIEFAERLSELLVEKPSFSFDHPPKIVRNESVEFKLKKLSNLEQLAFGLDDYRSSQQTFLNEATLITKEIAVSAWENMILTAANWLNYSEIIRNLPVYLKQELLQTTWLIWGKLERIAMTAQMRVNRQCGKDQFVVSHEHLIDFSRTKADMSWWSHYTYEELEYLFNPKDLHYDELVWEIIEIRPDSVELTYLLCSLSFGLAVNSISGELRDVVEELQDTLANDLHNYYTKRNKTSYTLRLRQLMKIYEKFIKLRNIRSEKYHICSILDVFKLYISNEEFFKVAC